MFVERARVEVVDADDAVAAAQKRSHRCEPRNPAPPGDDGGRHGRVPFVRSIRKRAEGVARQMVVGTVQVRRNAHGILTVLERRAHSRLRGRYEAPIGRLVTETMAGAWRWLMRRSSNSSKTSRSAPDRLRRARSGHSRNATTRTRRCRACAHHVRDQALAAMVLKLANTAYYGYARRIESLPDAVVLLGFASVKNLAITASITRLLATRPGRSVRRARRPIFDHCLSTAICARMLGRTRRISGEKAFVAGLLHDLGLIVLVCYAQGSASAQLYARCGRQATCRSSTSSSTCSAGRTPSSARALPPSGSSRRPCATRCASTTIPLRRRPTRCSPRPCTSRTGSRIGSGTRSRGFPASPRRTPLRSRPSASTPTRSRASRMRQPPRSPRTSPSARSGAPPNAARLQRLSDRCLAP